MPIEVPIGLPALVTVAVPVTRAPPPHHHHHAESFSLDKAPDFTAPPPTHYRKFKRLLAPRGTAAFDNDPTVQAVPIAVLTSAGQVRKLKTRPSDPYFEETGKSSTIISQVTHVAELLITYDGPVRQSLPLSRPPARPPARRPTP